MTQEDILKLQAIDVHSHFGEDGDTSPLSRIQNGSEGFLLRSMASARIGVSINSHRAAFGPERNGGCAAANLKLVEAIHHLPGVYGWVVVNPFEKETFAQAREYVTDPKIVGIKIHPLGHGYKLLEEGEPIFALAEELGVPVLGHGGEEANTPEDYGILAARHGSIPVIAAHLGNSDDDDINHYVRAIQDCPTGNLYTDTSSSMSILAGITEAAVAAMGSDHILFGTDASYYFSPAQRARIDYAEISPQDKYNILRGNAEKIFGGKITC